MKYSFNFFIQKDGSNYGTNETAAIYLAGELESRVTTVNSMLEYRIATELKATQEVELTNVEKEYLIGVISSLPIDNFFKGQVAHPLVAASINGVPTEVTLWQLRSELSIKGMESLVTLAIEAFPESTPEEIAIKTIAKTAWEKANLVSRNSSTLQVIKGVLGLTDAQVDEIFKAAQLIEA